MPYTSRYRPDALALADLDGNGSLDVATVSYYHDLVVLKLKLYGNDLPSPPNRWGVSLGERKGLSETKINTFA